MGMPLSYIAYRHRKEAFAGQVLSFRASLTFSNGSLQKIKKLNVDFADMISYRVL